MHGWVWFVLATASAMSMTLCLAAIVRSLEKIERELYLLNTGRP